MIWGRGSIAQWLAHLFRTKLPGLNSQHSQKKFRGKNANVAAVNQRCCLEENGQRLENVNKTHLVVASQYYKNIMQNILDGLF